MIEAIYLHIGPHKTGSTTIQELLGKNANILKAYGYLYPSFKINGRIYFNHSIPFVRIFRIDASKNTLNSNGFSSSKDEHEQWQKMIDEQLKEQLGQFKGKYLIVSGEEICLFSVLQLSSLKKYLIGITHERVKIKIILLARHPVDLFQSDTIEHIKHNKSLNNRIQFNMKKYQYFYQKLFNTLRQVFEKQNVVVYSFEESIRHSTGQTSYFMLKLGANEPLISHLSNEQYNSSISYESVVLLSAINDNIPIQRWHTDVVSSGIRDEFIRLKGSKFMFSPVLQREIWNMAKEDTDAMCEAFLLPRYQFREKQVPQISERWSAETLNHLHSIFVSAPKEIKLIILEVLTQELTNSHNDFSKIQKDRILKFIAESTSYIPILGKVKTYDFILKNMGYWKGISAIKHCLIDNMICLMLKKWRAFSINLRTLAEEKTPKHDIASVLFKNSYLHFISIGRDPWFLIENPAPDRRIKCLSIVLSVPENTVCQIFFTNTINEDFSESKSLCYFAIGGKNKAYFEFPSLEMIVKIRIDPGQVAGEYCLHSVKIETK